MRRSGFTLLELSCVLAVMALLTAVAVPSYQALVYRAQAAEAPPVLDAIAHAERQYFRDHGAFLACPATGELPLRPTPLPDEPCWHTLGVILDGGARFRYGVDLDGGSFVVTAAADLDRDGAPSRFRLDGTTLALDVVDPLE